MFIIALNGPPRVGKDTAGGILQRYIPNSRCFKFASILKRAVHMSFGLMVAEDYFEEVKDKPAIEFFGETPRRAYINHSEHYMKLLYGKDIFGRLLLKQLDQLSRSRLKAAIITDCGFVEELQVLGQHHTILLVRLYRPEHDFSKDSRSYLAWENSVDIPNDGDIKKLSVALEDLARNYHL